MIFWLLNTQMAYVIRRYRERLPSLFGTCQGLFAIYRSQTFHVEIVEHCTTIYRNDNNWKERRMTYEGPRPRPAFGISLSRKKNKPYCGWRRNYRAKNGRSHFVSNKSCRLPSLNLGGYMSCVYINAVSGTSYTCILRKLLFLSWRKKKTGEVWTVSIGIAKEMPAINLNENHRGQV